MEEIWKDIDGYNGNYQISNLGRVRSKKHRVKNYIRGGCNTDDYKILTQYVSRKTGYSQIVLSRNYSEKLYLVHRLVATYFIPNPENKRTVNHKNGIKTDNRVDNLEWMTHKENIKHSFDNGLQPECYWNGKFGEKHSTSKNILQFDINGCLIKEWSCISDAAREFNINSSGITHCAKGHRKTCAGFIWEYKK